jgi:chromosome segregation ATPase
MNDQQKAEYGRLQNQQGSAKKTIDEMIEEEKKSQSPNKERLKNLESLAKDMQEVQDELADGNVSERTVEKQQKILTRMLDAIRTENKRDISKKREGKQGKDYYSDISEEELERLRREALQDMIRRDRRKFKKDYEQIIRKYYENIEGK